MMLLYFIDTANLLINPAVSKNRVLKICKNPLRKCVFCVK